MTIKKCNQSLVVESEYYIARTDIAGKLITNIVSEPFANGNLYFHKRTYLFVLLKNTRWGGKNPNCRYLDRHI